MKKYEIKPSGSSNIAAALALNCAQGRIGEPLVRNGCNQAAFALFIAKLAHEQLVEKKKTAQQLADMFEAVSAANASAARQALAKCDIYADEETARMVKASVKKRGGSKEPVKDSDIKNEKGEILPFLLEDYWIAVGGAKIVHNLSMFD